jgi:hypothetical protein
MATGQLGRPAFSTLLQLGTASAIGVTAALAAMGSAKAASLPPATYELDVDASNPNVTPNDIFACQGGALGANNGCIGSPTLQHTTGTTLTVGSLSNYGASASSTLVNPASGPLSISVSASARNGASASASGEVDYYLKVTGTTLVDGMIPVRLNIAAHANVTLSDPFDGVHGDFHAGASAGAGIEVSKPVGLNPFSPDGIAYQQVLASFSLFSQSPILPTSIGTAAGQSCPFETTCVPTADLNNANMLFMLQPDLQYLITVFADADTQDRSGASSQSANASVDPHFFLDPIVDPFDQLLLSPNANNDAPGVAGVPELSTWAMMLIGLAGLGFSGYRRARRRVIVA